MLCLVQLLKVTLRTASTPNTPLLAHKQDIKKTSSGSLYSTKPSASPSTSVADIYQMAVNEVRGNGTVPPENNPNNNPHR